MTPANAERQREKSMTQNVWFIAAIWMALALSASLISIWAGISVALVEILVGVIAGNFLGIHATTDWINFLALLGSGVLTFLAGAEIDPRSLKANLRASGLIGVLSFGVPFVIVWLFAFSTTSVAVVYAVMIEGGYGDTAMGKTILAACFITDLGTVLALGVLFANFNLWLLVFVVVMCVVLRFMPRWTQSIIERLGATRVSEPEVKFIFLILFFLGGLATTAKSEAVLPAYLVGLVVAGVFLRDKTLVNRMRSIAFAIFTPFYFIKAGLYVSLPLLWAGLGIIGALLLLKMITKLVGVFPLARMHYMGKREASYTTLLMATGLTFGTISALFGLQNSVVILSAFIPTLIAQKFFQPSLDAMHAWGRLYRKRMRVLSVEDVGDNGDMKNE
jgi:Kef-type K+ transport system membrane component KefB